LANEGRVDLRARNAAADQRARAIPRAYHAGAGGGYSSRTCAEQGRQRFADGPEVRCLRGVSTPHTRDVGRQLGRDRPTRRGMNISAATIAPSTTSCPNSRQRRAQRSHTRRTVCAQRAPLDESQDISPCICSARVCTPLHRRLGGKFALGWGREIDQEPPAPHPERIGATGFEPATFRSQSGCATRLRYAPPARQCSSPSTTAPHRSGR
jgi:hypothetical protein